MRIEAFLEAYSHVVEQLPKILLRWKRSSMESKEAFADEIVRVLAARAAAIGKIRRTSPPHMALERIVDLDRVLRSHRAKLQDLVALDPNVFLISEGSTVVDVTGGMDAVASSDENLAA